MTQDRVPAYPRGHGNHIDGPEIERLARSYQVHPDQLESLLGRLRALEAAAVEQHAAARTLAGQLAPGLLAGQVLVAVLDHHGPVVGIRGVYCDGCDTDGEPPPDWPCTTWQLIAERAR